MSVGLPKLLIELLNAPMAGVAAGERPVPGLSCLADEAGRVSKWTLRFPERLPMKALREASGWQWLPAVDHVAPPGLGQDVHCLEVVSRASRPYGVIVAAVRNHQVLEVSRFPGSMAPAE